MYFSATQKKIYIFLSILKGKNDTIQFFLFHFLSFRKVKNNSEVKYGSLAILCDTFTHYDNSHDTDALIIAYLQLSYNYFLMM